VSDGAAEGGASGAGGWSGAGGGSGAGGVAGTIVCAEAPQAARPAAAATAVEALRKSRRPVVNLGTSWCGSVVPILESRYPRLVVTCEQRPAAQVMIANIEMRKTPRNSICWSTAHTRDI
jgi:hypothetical protein